MLSIFLVNFSQWFTVSRAYYRINLLIMENRALLYLANLKAIIVRIFLGEEQSDCCTAIENILSANVVGMCAS